MLFIQISQIDDGFLLSLCVLICLPRSTAIVVNVCDYQVCLFSHPFVSIGYSKLERFVLDFWIHNGIVIVLLIRKVVLLMLDGHIWRYKHQFCVGMLRLVLSAAFPCKAVKRAVTAQIEVGRFITDLAFQY